jgi:hypothetical protein
MGQLPRAATPWISIFAPNGSAPAWKVNRAGAVLASGNCRRRHAADEAPIGFRGEAEGKPVRQTFPRARTFDRHDSPRRSGFELDVVPPGATTVNPYLRTACKI